MDSIFYWTAKLFWLLASPDSLLVLLIVVCWLLLRLGVHGLAKRLLGLVALLMALIALFPVGEWMLYPLESRFAANPTLPRVDGIIMLGGAGDQRRSLQWQQIELNQGAERYITFVSLAETHPQARLVFTGGAGAMQQQAFKEAALAKTFMENQGIGAERIVFEDESRNTYENVIFSQQLVNPLPGENWVLITTAWHMPRSVGIFCHAGWPVIPYPVDHYSLPESLFRIEPGFAEHLQNLKLGAKEWLGLIAYYVTGKTSAFLPDGCEATKTFIESPE